MFDVNKKSTSRRAGVLCLIGFGIAVTACQPERVAPQARSNPQYVTTPHTATDSVQVNYDQPPKDVGDGH